MIEWLPDLLLPLGLGLILGGLYFAGLWWTITWLPRSRRPAFTLAASFFIRAALLVAGIVWLTGGQPVRVVAALVGFWISRQLSMRWRIALVAGPSGAETLRHQ